MVRVPPLRSLLLGASLVALGGCYQTKHHISKVPPQRPDPVAAPAPRPLPQGTFEGSGGSLLDEYAKRRERPPGPKNPKEPEEFIPSEEEVRGFSLPNNSKKIVTSLLTFAAQDNLARANTLFTQQARWGVPDRREPEARSVHEAGGAVFFDVLRNVAGRFGAKENLTCPPIMPAATVYVRNGAEPMWCFYISNDNLDILAFKFLHENGSAKIDYVGLHEVRPQGQIQRPGAIPPPMTPNLRRATRMPPGLERPTEGPLAPDGQLQNPDQPPQPVQPPIVVPGAPPVGPPDAQPAGTGTQPTPTKAGTQPTPTKAATPTPAPAKAPAPTPTKAPTPAPAPSH
jgi:hypothetical protein